jgi:hypothetical protein
MKPPIATIINFCTIEARFLKDCIEQCRSFSRQIIIPVCDHFFNGAPENHELLDQIYAAFPDCQFIEYPFAPERVPKRVFREISPDHFWHCASRMIGTRFLNDDIETVLFLDADELPDGKKFSEWLEMSDYLQHTVLKMANYWYFREIRYQSMHWEDSVVLVQKHALSSSVLLHENERDAIYDLSPGPKRRSVAGPDGQPMFHHFSWVRTKEEMMNKVRAWGHRRDRNWQQLVEEEFSAPFSGKDFVHGYSFREWIPLFDISLDKVHFAPHPQMGAQLRRLNAREFADHLELAERGWWKKIFNF